MHHLTQAADAGVVESYSPLGAVYLEGYDGKPPNMTLAMQYFASGANMGDGEWAGGAGLVCVFLAIFFIPCASQEHRVATQCSEARWGLACIHAHLSFFPASSPIASLALLPPAAISKFNLGIGESQGWRGQRNCTAAALNFKDVSFASEWLLSLSFADDDAYDSFVNGNLDVALRQVGGGGLA